MLQEPQLQLDLVPHMVHARLDDGGEVTFDRMDVRGHPRLTTRAPTTQIPSAVLLRDSFAEALIPLLAPHIGKATWIWTYEFPAREILDARPALVVEELVERKLMVLKPTNPPELSSP